MFIFGVYSMYVDLGGDGHTEQTPQEVVTAMWLRAILLPGKGPASDSTAIGGYQPKEGTLSAPAAPIVVYV